MDLHEALELVKFDKRMLDWNLKQRIITQAEYETHLKGLQDIGNLAEQVTLQDADDADIGDYSHAQ